MSKVKGKTTKIAPPDPTPAQLRAQEGRDRPTPEEPKARKGFLKGLNGARVPADELDAALKAEEEDRQIGKGWCTWWIIAEDKEEFKAFPKLAGERVTYLRQLSVLYHASAELREFTISELNTGPLILESLVKLGYLEKGKFGHRATKLARDAWQKAVEIGRDHKFAPRPVDKRPQGYHVTATRSEGKTTIEVGRPNRFVAQEGELEMPAVERGAVRRAPPPRKSKTPSTARIELLVEKNPHRVGSDYHGYFEALRGGGTADEYVARGGHKIALAKYLKQGIIKMVEE